MIAGNVGNGILISGSYASGTVIQGYRIGSNGVRHCGAAERLGRHPGDDRGQAMSSSVGTAPGDNLGGNLISGNGRNGIEVVNSTATVIRSNRIGTDMGGLNAVGNTLDGVFLATTTGVTIGGYVDNRNTIAGNGLSGIVLSNAVSTAIFFNFIGTSLGACALGNSGDGINMAGISSATTVISNIIDANAANGVELGVNAAGLILTGNFIGRPDGSIRGNATGVLLDGQNVTVGGTGGAL